MRGNTHFTVPKDLLKRLHGMSPSERLLHRLHAVALVMAGRSASEVARMYGNSPRAVAYWVTWYKKKGLAGLDEESRPGRPSKLNPSQLKKLQAFVKRSRKRSEPLKVHILRDYIKDSFGVTVTIRQCFRILKRFNS
jgi:transposase